jgi:hypothetical protein
MRAQQTTMRLMPGNDTAEVNEQLRAPQQPEPGTGPDAHDARPPSQVYAPVAFEGEEKARASRIRAARKHCKPPGR